MCVCRSKCVYVCVCVLMCTWIYEGQQISWRYRVAKTDPQDVSSCRSLSANLPIFIGFFCGKWPAEIMHPVSRRHPSTTIVDMHIKIYEIMYEIYELYENYMKICKIHEIRTKIMESETQKVLISKIVDMKGKTWWWWCIKYMKYIWKYMKFMKYTWKCMKRESQQIFMSISKRGDVKGNIW